ncbi:MAG: response regulator transcription factor [Bacteroidales bacterium]|nr:response regulator transcription factor [Bacteroidales bacterium]MCF8389983.1 response regulator transcription factor [Bacteroidales bacterium]
MISVSIVEDDHIIREGIEEFLNNQEDMYCLFSRESVESLLSAMETHELPDVILMDIGLPGMSGISGMKIISERYPDINIIMFTVHNDSHKIFQSLCAGASGYLLKSTPFPKIKDAIKIVYEGGSFMSPQIARKVIAFFQNNKIKPNKSILTEKEKEIVLGLVDGLSYKMIADRSCISIETVRSHIKNIYKKLHVHSKADVIRKSLSGEI